MVVFLRFRLWNKGVDTRQAMFLGNNNLIYLEDGTLAATMYEVSDREAIAEETCFE